MTSKSKTIRLTAENAHQCLGRDVIFRAYNKDTLKWNHVVSRALRVSKNSVSVVNCSVEFTNVAVYVLLD
jgi:hypothetical protein